MFVLFSEPGGRNGGVRLDQEHRGDANFLPWQRQPITSQNGHCQEKPYGNHQRIRWVSKGPLSEQVQTYIKQEERYRSMPDIFENTLFVREKACNICLKSTGLSQKGSFSLLSLQPIKSTHQKKLDIETFPQTHTIRKHQRSHL